METILASETRLNKGFFECCAQDFLDHPLEFCETMAH